MNQRLLLIATMAALAGSAHAVTGVQNVTTTLEANGDRRLNQMGFVGSSTLFDASNLQHFADGELRYGTSRFGWNDRAPRDVSTAGNRYPGNPDRADRSSSFANEGTSEGTLREVFSSANLSWIIDGEDKGAWEIDLLFNPGLRLLNDGDRSTVEIAILERGGNSDLGIRGITLVDGVKTYTEELIIRKNQFTRAGWDLNTLEIGENQPVVGVGISLDEFQRGVGDGLIGISLFSRSNFNGPDIVGVATAAPVPEPATLALLGAGVAAIAARRKRRNAR